MLLVAGATGTTGSQVVHALLERGHDVRIFARDPDKAERLFEGAVQLAVGDFDDARSVREALEGVERLFLSGADDPRRVAWETNAIDAAVAAGVSTIVKLSSIVAEPGARVAFWDWHGRIEKHLRASDVSAVALHSSFSMANVLAAVASVVRDGTLYAPAGRAKIAMIHPRDVGAAAAAALTTEGHAGRTYVLTGPKAIDYAEVAAELSGATGRDVEFVDVPDDAARQGMIAAGLPAFLAAGIVEIFASARQGGLSTVTTTVEALTGEPPRSFASFARDHAHLFTPTAVDAVR